MLGLLGAVAVSLSIVSPTLAISLNPQAIAEEVGGAIPLIYVLALLPVTLIAGAFAVLISRLGSVDSVVGLLTATVGPRAGAATGFVLLSAYVVALPGTLAAFGLFTQSLALRVLGRSLPDWPLFVVASLMIVVGFLIARRTIAIVGNVLLSIEGLSVLSIVLVSAVALVTMLMGLGSPEQTVTFTDFSVEGVPLSAIGIALTFAVVSVAGFEAAAAVGESTKSPRRTIPLAVMGTAGGAIIFYATVAAVAVWTFGESAADYESMSVTSSLPAALADEFFAPWVGTVLTIMAALTCLAGAIGACVAGSRMIVALARQGLLPAALTEKRPDTDEPGRALASTAALGLLATLGCVVLVGPHLFRVFELAGVVTGFLFLSVYATVCAVAARVLMGEGKLLGGGLMAAGCLAAVLIFAVTLVPLPQGWARWGPALALAAIAGSIILGMRHDHGQRVGSPPREPPSR